MTRQDVDNVSEHKVTDTQVQPQKEANEWHKSTHFREYYQIKERKEKMKKGRLLILAITLLVVMGLLGACTGDIGPAGSIGPQGAVGDPGPQGEDGSQGQTGETGLQGETGLEGPQGLPGADGADGPDGASGTPGATGATGSTGSGSRGTAGARGPEGAQGPTGAQGPSGALPPFSIQLQTKNAATSVYDATIFSWEVVVHLTTTGTPGAGDEARIVLTPLQPMTLRQVKTIAWLENLVSGYQPHVDILLDTTGDSLADDALVIEYAYNTTGGVVRSGWPTYGSLLGAWYQTFSDDGLGPTVINDTAYAWLSWGAAGSAGGTFGQGDHWGITLGQWKTGQTVNPVAKGVGSFVIDANTPVVRIEIEVDNWIVQSEAYIDNITINGVPLPD